VDGWGDAIIKRIKKELVFATRSGGPLPPSEKKGFS